MSRQVEQPLIASTPRGRTGCRKGAGCKSIAEILDDEGLRNLAEYIDLLLEMERDEAGGTGIKAARAPDKR